MVHKTTIVYLRMVIINLGQPFLWGLKPRASSSEQTTVFFFPCPVSRRSLRSPPARACRGLPGRRCSAEVGILESGTVDPIPWMDEILHHLRNPGRMIPLEIPTKNAFPWFQSGAGFRPSTVSINPSLSIQGGGALQKRSDSPLAILKTQQLDL